MTASWWNGMGNLLEADARRKKSPICARIGKLKRAPPKQSELRSDAQGGALCHGHDEESWNALRRENARRGSGARGRYLRPRLACYFFFRFSNSF